MKKGIENLKSNLELIKKIINKKFLLYYLAILILLCGGVTSYYLIKYSNTEKNKKINNNDNKNIDYIRAAIIERSLSDIKKNEYQEYLKSNEVINQSFIYNAEAELKEVPIKNENNFRNFIEEKLTIKTNINEIKLPKNLYEIESGSEIKEQQFITEGIIKEKEIKPIKEEVKIESSQIIISDIKKTKEKVKSESDEISKLIERFEAKKGYKKEETISEKTDTSIKEEEYGLKKLSQPTKLKIITGEEDIIFQPKIENIKKSNEERKIKEEGIKQKEIDNFSLIKLLE